jgi:hypothetical protein
MRFGIAAAMIVLAAGCKDDAIVALETARERVCSCKDATCVNAAMDAMADHPTKDPRRAEAIAREITDCVARIYKLSDAAPEPPPPPPSNDAAPAPPGPPDATGP